MGALELPQLLFGGALCCPDELLGGGYGQRSIPGDPLGQNEGRTERLTGLSQPGHQTVVGSFLGGDRISGNGHLHGRAVADTTGQPEQASSCGKQAHPNLRYA